MWHLVKSLVVQLQIKNTSNADKIENCYYVNNYHWLLGMSLEMHLSCNSDARLSNRDFVVPQLILGCNSHQIATVLSTTCTWKMSSKCAV